NDRWPDSELDTFISARCGWIGGDFRGNISYLAGDVPLERAAELSAERIETFVTEYRDRVDGPIDLGLHIGRIDDHVVVTMVAAKRTITLEPRPITFDKQGTI